ncbi:MAG: mechanosensitive ion channel [Bdellovibrionales bacterium]|nr:mechanosensitive ion channel [Bdellovibrionales bacterium]
MMDSLIQFIEQMQHLFFWMPDVWGLQFFEVDGKPVTFGKITTGLLLLILGYYLARKVTRQIELRLLARLDVEDSLRYTLKTMIFYMMLVVLTLFTLRLLNVPITIFTVLGGALAIGVGLGAQNIVNNFISGLIIMMERPIRVGDFIELESIAGTIESIGARATRIKSVENTHIVVPNSSFLEKNVLNWTLSDDIVRAKVRVGVAYGSPTKRTEELLKSAVMDHPKVLSSPEPVVLFEDFGDNALVFDVLFWARIRNQLQLKTIASDIRFTIDDLFQKDKICIAFPQRDVHLDSLSPIQVQMLPSTGERPS